MIGLSGVEINDLFTIRKFKCFRIKVVVMLRISGNGGECGVGLLFYSSLYYLKFISFFGYYSFMKAALAGAHYCLPVRIVFQGGEQTPCYHLEEE